MDVKVPSLFSYLRDGYSKYRAHRHGLKVYHDTTAKLEKLRRSGNIIPKDVEQLMSQAPKVTKPLSIKLRKLWDVMSRSLGQNNVYQNSYDFDRMANIYEKEPYMTRSIGYYVESALRDPHKMVGNSPGFVDYIIRRFKEMEVVTDQDMRLFDRQALLSLLLFGNIIISRRRNDKACSGKPYRRFDGKEFDPVAGYFVEDPRAFTIEKDENGQTVYRRHGQSMGALSYTYEIGGHRFNVPFGASYYDKDKVFHKDEVIHVRFHPLPGNIWGMPPFLGVADDLVTLRSIEECVELLVYQYGHPFIHAAVGVDNIPGTDPEIEATKTEIENMEGNGVLVTTNRVEITSVTGTGGGVDLNAYLQYFKARVFAGLNISGNVAGEGETANKDSSFTMSKVQSGFTTELQTHMRMMYSQMVNDYKYEFPLPISRFFHPQYEVYPEYPEVDINSKILLENHYYNAFTQDIMTRTEVRQAMGRKALSNEQTKDTFSSVVTMAEAEQQHTWAMQETKALSATGLTRTSTSSTSTAKKKQEGSKNQSKSKTTPSNQHGTKRTNSPKKG